MFNFLFSQELVLSRELKSLLLQGPGALLMHLPISLQSPLTKGYLDFFLEKSLITQGNDAAAAGSPCLCAGAVAVCGMHFFVGNQQSCQPPCSPWNTAPHIL